MRPSLGLTSFSSSLHEHPVKITLAFRQGLPRLSGSLLAPHSRTVLRLVHTRVDMDSDEYDRPTSSRGSRQSGFSIGELLVAIAVVAILLTLVLAAAQKVRGRMRATQCITNLRQIAVGFRLYAQDNRGFLPQPALANKSWEQMIAPFYSGSYWCPADGELSRTVGSSYDWRDTGDPATSFAGKPLSAIGPSDAVLAFDALPGWHVSREVMVARLDGAVASIRQEECFQQLIQPTPRNSVKVR